MSLDRIGCINSNIAKGGIIHKLLSRDISCTDSFFYIQIPSKPQHHAPSYHITTSEESAPSTGNPLAMALRGKLRNHGEASPSGIGTWFRQQLT